MPNPATSEQGEERGEERSDEWKVVSYVGRLYVRGASDKLNEFLEERRYGMLFILSL